LSPSTFRRQVVVGLVHVDVLRVAAARRQLDREQGGRLGRARMVGVVGVERLARDDASPVHELVVGDIGDVRVPRDVVLLLVVRLQIAEQLHGGDELVGREMLVAHDQHVMVDERLVERGARLGVDRLREVEPDDLGPGVVRQWRDGEGRH
jgi:hypothetical protein